MVQTTGDVCGLRGCLNNSADGEIIEGTPVVGYGIVRIKVCRSHYLMIYGPGLSHISMAPNENVSVHSNVFEQDEKRDQT